MNKCYYYHFLIIPTKNPQFKKNRISYSALPNQSSDFTPPSTRNGQKSVDVINERPKSLPWNLGIFVDYPLRNPQILGFPCFQKHPQTYKNIPPTKFFWGKLQNFPNIWVFPVPEAFKYPLKIISLSSSRDKENQGFLGYEH